VGEVASSNLVVPTIIFNQLRVMNALNGSMIRTWFRRFGYANAMITSDHQPCGEGTPYVLQIATQSTEAIARATVKSQTQNLPNL
jgi:flagellar biosynthesis/type III secretory pathway chaperone